MKRNVFIAVTLIFLIVNCLGGCSADIFIADENYQVTFYSDDNKVLKIDSVQKNMSATPPIAPMVANDSVFCSWDKDFSKVTQDMDVYPVCEKISEKENVFAVVGAYGKTDEEITVSVKLCGKVCLSGFDILIKYDSQMLELQDVSEDGAVIYNESKLGEIRLNYVSVENTTADVDVCNLTFLPKAEQGAAPISIEVNSICACEGTVESNNDNIYFPNYCTVDGAVFVMP